MPSRAETGVKGRVDWGFVAAVGGLLAMGTLAVLSAASPMPYFTQILQRHFTALGLGAFLFLFGLGFNYQIFQDQAKAIYAMILSILLLVLMVGITQRGHRAWFHLPFITFQPSELARVGFILVLADILDRRARKIADLSTVLWALGIAAPVMILIMRQPDLATTLTFFPVLLGMLFCAGADVFHILAVAGYGAVTMSIPLLYIFCQVHSAHPAAGRLAAFILQTSRMGAATLSVLVGIALLGAAAWKASSLLRLRIRPAFFAAVSVILAAGFISGVAANRQLKGYQRNRLVAYLAPRSDIQGAAYNVHQSQISIGSGGLWGKGIFSGTQSQLGFLPERHTDFIYAVVGEEMGFFGTMGILALYLVLIWRIVSAARLARDRYGYLVCSGIAAMFAFELVLNVGMCVGLMPVAGIPLPLISYGGSSLVVMLWALGIVANVYSRRYSLL